MISPQKNVPKMQLIDWANSAPRHQTRKWKPLQSFCVRQWTNRTECVSVQPFGSTYHWYFYQEQFTSVVKNIDEFILQPMYTELEHSKEECCKLRDQLKQTENTEVLVDDLRIQLQRVKKERQEAKATCRALQDKLDSSEADKLRLSRRIERVKSERDQVNAERQRLEVQFAEQGQLVRTRSCHKLLFHTFWILRYPCRRGSCAL